MPPYKRSGNSQKRPLRSSQVAQSDGMASYGERASLPAQTEAQGVRYTAPGVDPRAEAHTEPHPSRFPEDERMDAFPTRWRRGGALEAPTPPRGWSAKFVNWSDDRLRFRALREGWKPVTREEITRWPGGEYFKGIAGIAGDTENYFRVAELVLCKIPSSIVDERTAYYAGVNANAQAAVQQRLDDYANLQGHQKVRFYVDREHTSRVERGRILNPAPDEAADR